MTRMCGDPGCSCNAGNPVHDPGPEKKRTKVEPRTSKDKILEVLDKHSLRSTNYKYIPEIEYDALADELDDMLLEEYRRGNEDGPYR